MTYNLNRAIDLATQDALTDLKRDGLTDLSNPHAEAIISEHARNAVPFDHGHLIDVYRDHYRDLIDRMMDDAEGALYFLAAAADPLVNYEGIAFATHQLIIDRMTGYLQGLIRATVKP